MRLTSTGSRSRRKVMNSLAKATGELPDDTQALHLLRYCQHVFRQRLQHRRRLCCMKQLRTYVAHRLFDDISAHAPGWCGKCLHCRRHAQFEPGCLFVSRQHSAGQRV